VRDAVCRIGVCVLAPTEDAEKASLRGPATHKSLMMLPLRNLMDFLKYTPGRWG